MFNDKVLRILSILLLSLLIIFMFYFSGIRYKWLIDLPTAMALILGTILITGIRYKKNLSPQQLRRVIITSLLMASAFTLGTGIMGVLTMTKSFEQMVGGFAVTFITVPYTALLWIGIILYFNRTMTTSTANVDANVNVTIENNEAVPQLLTEQLTPREQEIIKELLLGKTNKEIAEALFISEPTVKRHLANIFAKLDVSNRQALIIKLHHEPKGV